MSVSVNESSRHRKIWASQTFPDFQVVVVKMEGAALMRKYWQAVIQASLSMSGKTSLHQSEKAVSLGTWSLCQPMYPGVLSKL